MNGNLSHRPHAHRPLDLEYVRIGSYFLEAEKALLVLEILEIFTVGTVSQPTRHEEQIPGHIWCISLNVILTQSIRLDRT